MVKRRGEQGIRCNFDIAAAIGRKDQLRSQYCTAALWFTQLHVRGTEDNRHPGHKSPSPFKDLRRLPVVEVESRQRRATRIQSPRISMVNKQHVLFSDTLNVEQIEEEVRSQLHLRHVRQVGNFHVLAQRLPLRLSMLVEVGPRTPLNLGEDLVHDAAACFSISRISPFWISSNHHTRLDLVYSEPMDCDTRAGTNACDLRR